MVFFGRRGMLIGTVSCATRTYRNDPCHNDLPVRCEARRRCSSYKTRRDTCDCIYCKSKFCFDIASGWNRWAFGRCTQDTRGKSSWFGLILGSFFGNPGRDAREVARWGGDERAAILETMEDARCRTRVRSGECRAGVVALPKTFPPRNKGTKVRNCSLPS